MKVNNKIIWGNKNVDFLRNDEGCKYIFINGFVKRFASCKKCYPLWQYGLSVSLSRELYALKVRRFEGRSNSACKLVPHMFEGFSAGIRNVHNPPNSAWHS